MFLWMKRFGTLAAILSALVFVFSPYLILDIFVRAAFPEFAAITLILGIFWALDRKRFFTLSLLTGLAIITHLPTFVIFAPIIAVYALLNRKNIVLIILSFILGIGLSSFYLLPAIFEQQFINIDNLRSGNFDFHKHFVYPQQLITYVWGYGGSTQGLNDNMSFQVGLIQWTILALSLLILIKIAALSASWRIARNDVIARSQTTKQSKQGSKGTPWKAAYLSLFLLASFFGLFMMMETSTPVWETFKFLQFLQFPWRYFMIISFSTAVLSGLLLSLVKKTSLASAIVFIVSITVLYLYSAYLKPEEWLPKDYYSDENIKVRGYFEPGYNPLGVEQVPTQEIPRYQANQDTQVQELLLKDNQLKLSINTPKPFVLTINSHFFPGWKVYIDEKETKITPSKSYWFLEIEVPEGKHIVEAKFTDTPVRVLANQISLGTVLGLLIVFLGYPKKP